MSRIVQIDGSIMEGGGQILRTASALSVLTGKPIRIFKIRAGRPQPGLRTQHLRGLQAVAGLCDGRLEGAHIGSGEVLFYPRRMTEKHLSVRIETAGSVGLVMQTLLMAALHAKEDVAADIDGGGTFGKYAPPLEHAQFVLLPLLRSMGYHSEINIIRHGFYPAGGAKVKAFITPCRALAPLQLAERGDIGEIGIISTASHGLRKPKVAERQSRAADAVLSRAGYSCNIKNRYSETPSQGCGIVIVAKTAGGSFIGADGLGEPGKKAEAVGAEAAQALLAELGSGASVDRHAADQLLPFMALSKGRSVITVPEVTMHARTNIYVINQFLDAEFITKKDGRAFRIECSPGQKSRPEGHP